MRLPIHDIRDDILASLAGGNRLVLTAPTGSGKSTQVPQFLLESAARPRDGQIIILQPRRLAARLLAERVAGELSTRTGELVGYQTRHESRIGPKTLIRFMTEGLFLRLLQSNPALDGVAAVLLDEFHERNIATDVSAAMLKLLQQSRRPDLRVIVMSATLDTQLIAAYLGCPVLEAHGRAFPVEITYSAGRRTAGSKSDIRQWRRSAVAPPWELAAEALEDLLSREGEGDILIFMPGAYEIRRTIEACRRVAPELSLFPLYSELPVREQDEALAPCRGRKAIVSTNVAETSITIPGIRHVIDSGLARINRFDARRGINVLMVEPISQASADQRAGRAGRTAPGTCIRLWSESEHRHRPAHTTPEVQRLDLAEVVLQLHDYGVSDPAKFPWLQRPDDLALRQATDTLLELDALKRDTDCVRLTKLGRTMSRLPMHPRLSRMLVEAAGRKCLERGALWAAFISERDIIERGQGGALADDLPKDFPRSDFLVLEAAMRFARSVQFDPARCAAKGIQANAAREIDRTHRLYLDAAGRTMSGVAGRDEATGQLIALAECLLVAFPDHLALRRNPANLACALAGGKRGQLDGESVAAHAGLLLPVEVREIGAGQQVRTVLSLVTEIHPDWLRAVHPDQIEHRRETFYNADAQAVESADREIFRGLVIDESPVAEVDEAKAAEILADRIIAGELKLEKWDESVEQWIARTRCVAEWFPERRLIRYEDDERRLIVQEICAGATRYSQVKDRPCLPAVRDALSWDDQRFVETMAPERIALPRGWRMRIDYTPGSPPRGRAKIQDLYGLNETPRIAGGRVPVVLEILAPSMRPVQLTEDLGNFWKNLYPTLKKELARKYPKHEWR